MTLEDNSVDSLVTDPPYELGFMGKSWDSTGIAYNVELWKECLRVLKPGGHLLAFGGTRTYHRMTCAIEDAGFEIRDCIQWIYGSGFPKSHNISKAIDKKAGAEREVVGTYQHPDGKPRNIDNHKANKDARIADQEWGMKQSGFQPITAPATSEAKQWDGWGTALKPANEPIVLARKPISEKTIAENVMKWGTGGLNIDGCRVGVRETVQYTGAKKPKDESGAVCYGDYNYERATVPLPEGRFPANVILDEEAGALLDEQSGKVSYGNKSGGYSYTGASYEVEGFVKNCKPQAPSNYGDSGGASRFFKNINYTSEELDWQDYEEPTRFKYCAKASKKERGEGNIHPTVKPIKLMEYLITLITPPNGIVLDPFLGSGTTALAALNLGRFFIGIEKEPKYVELARKRVKEHKAQLRLTL